MRACRRRGGAPAALASGAVLVGNAAFVEHSILVACESWWTAFAVAAVDLATREGALRPWTRWGGAGACIGLAFLTKGTGVLLLAAIAAWVLLGERRRAWRPLGWLCAGFAAGAWPLLVRNQLRFGDPLWNLNSRRAMWLDSWKQFYDPAAMQQASAAHYLASHSPGDILARFAVGAVKQSVHLLEACAPLAAPASVGLLLLALLAVGGLRMADRKLRTLLLILTGLWLASFAWYAPIASDRRFLAVLVPIATPALIPWASRLPLDLRPVPSRAARPWRSPPCCSPGGRRRRCSARFEPPRRATSPCTRSWRSARATTPTRSTCSGRARTSASIGTASCSRRERPVPRDAAQLERWLRGSMGERYRLLVVERHAGPRRLGDEWVDVSAAGGLGATRLPADWQQVAAFPPEAPRVLVFGR